MRGFLESHAIPPEISPSSPPRIPSALDMMRYQRVMSPDCLPLNNGRKPSILRTYEEEDAAAATRATNYSPIEAKPIIRARSTTTASTNPSPSRDHQTPSPHSDSPTPIATSPAAIPTSTQPNGKHHDINGGGGGKGGDLLFQWGHNKRSRGSRSESRAAGDDPSVINRRRTIKIRRRSTAEKLMPPPPPPPPPTCGTYTRGANLRHSLPCRDPALLHHRAVDERSSGQPRSERRSPPSPPEKHPRKASANGCATLEWSANPDAKSQPHDQDPPAEKPHLEWPRIYVSLSRKEKEEDFLAMKGTKLPQRPKKRAKNIDKTLQYCFPGMWLSDLTRGRYEVREKKCVKKKRRGLKGMESVDSDSD